MPARTIIEWQCARCGNEEAIGAYLPHGWKSLHRAGYQGNPGREPGIGGDICPDCAKAFAQWWLAPKQMAKISE